MSGRQQQRRRATAARTARRFLTIVFVAKIPTSPGRETPDERERRRAYSLSTNQNKPGGCQPAGLRTRGPAACSAAFLLQHSAVVAYAHKHKHTYTHRSLLFSVFCRSADRIFRHARDSAHSREKQLRRSSEKPIDALRRTLSTGPIFQGVRGR